MRSSHEGTDPESVSEEAEKNTPEGEVASEYMKNLLEGGSVYLEYDSELTDTYGRTLCYVYLHNKETMVNEFLVKNGYARTLTIRPNDIWSVSPDANIISLSYSKGVSFDDTLFLYDQKR